MSPELIHEYFDSVGIRKECPACGRTRWLLEPDTEGFGTGVVQVRADGRDKHSVKSSLLYVLAICENCGYLRQHARPMIVRWAKAREGGGEQTPG